MKMFTSGTSESSSCYCPAKLPGLGVILAEWRPLIQVDMLKYRNFVPTSNTSYNILNQTGLQIYS